MTINELHNIVKLELDKTSSLELPSFEQEEIDYWLNRTINLEVKELVDLYLKSSKDNILLSRIQDDLKPLFGYSSSISYSAGSLPADYLFIIEAYAKIERVLEDGSTDSYILSPCEIINESEVNKYLTTAYNNPYFDKPKYVINRSWGSNLITDAFTSGITSLDLTYIKIPTKVEDVTPNRDTEYTDLPKHMHYKIASRAAMLMLENIESERFKTDIQLINNEL